MTEQALTINEITLRFAAAGLFVGAGPSLDPLEIKLIGSREQFTALLPTPEEQQALKALRAGCGTRMKVCRDNGWRWTADCDTENETLVHLFADTYVDVGGRDYAGYDTPMAALAAAGRALEEGEKR